MEEQCSAGLAEGQVPELVQDDCVQAQHARGNASGFALGLFLLQRVDQVHGRVEAHSLAVTRDASHADGGRQMAFPGPRSTHQHDVVRRLVNVVSANCITNLRSTGETSNSNPARSLCTGNFAEAIW